MKVSVSPANRYSSCGRLSLGTDYMALSRKGWTNHRLVRNPDGVVPYLLTQDGLAFVGKKQLAIGTTSE